MTYNNNNGYQSYKKAYETESYMDQLLRLYEELIKLSIEVNDAIETEDYQKKFNLVERACSIVNGLQSILDYEQGGDIAKVLENYYSSIDFRLLHIQCYDDKPVCDSVIRDLKIMKAAWEDVSKQVNEGSTETDVASAVVNEMKNNDTEASLNLSI